MNVGQKAVVAVGADVPEEVLTTNAVENALALLQEGMPDAAAVEFKEDGNDLILNPVEPEDEEDEESELETDQAPDEMMKALGIGKASWMTELKCNKQGRPYQTPRNAEIIFTNDQNLIGLFGLNTFSGKTELRKEPEWRKVSSGKTLPQSERAVQPGKSGRLWSTEVPDRELHESDYRELRAYLSEHYSFDKMSEIRECVQLMAYRNRFHPVKMYLEGTKWTALPDWKLSLSTALVSRIASTSGQSL